MSANRMTAAIAAALLLAWAGAGRADALSDLPARWQPELAPVAEADVSGAEALMQQAIASARAEVAALLGADAGADTGADRRALATAYGRLGALLLLVEVEALADTSLRNAMTLDPAEPRWPYYAGYLANLAGNLDAAVAYLEQARAIDPDYPTLYLRLGKVRLDRSEPALARAALEEVLARAPEEPRLVSPANYYLGQLALLERRYDDAVRHLQAALAANPEATEVHYPLAQALRATGDEAGARAHLAAFKLRSPEVADPLLDELNAATRQSLPAFKRAIHAIREGDYATGIARLNEGLAVEPGNAAARVRDRKSVV